jgi:ATP-independent RNA helicase DbpA
MTQKNIFEQHLRADIVEHLKSIGYLKPTAIQTQTLPYIIEKKDIIARANTGSGKTLSFALGILNNFKKSTFDIQSLVLCPTRELANQVASEIRKVMKVHHNVKVMTLCGGVPYKPQVHSLSHKAHILVGTPGRVLKHLQNNNFNTNLIETLVLDEADRMLDMGFMDDVKKIIEVLPKKRQTLLFSATYPSNIEELASNIMQNPSNIKIENQEENKINQLFFQSELHNKKNNILKILDLYTPKSTIIFCNMKIDCDNLADELEEQEIYPLVLHSDLEQKDRDETITLFSNKSYKILIATDVASRGLDIDDIELVINHSLPRDSEVYTHRIGRTARAGKSGHAISLISQNNMLSFEDINIKYNFPLEKEIPTPTHKYDDLPEYKTLFISGGKKQKLRAGDILGALTAGIGLDKNDIGKIDIKEFCSYVAIKSNQAKKAQKELNIQKIKNRHFRVNLI